MLGKLASVLSSAVDVIAPPVPLQDEFIYHWNSITNFFIDKTSDGKAPIQDTKIPSHLDEMLSILLQEEEEQKEDEFGPCMEYVLHNKLLDTLCTLARADCPPGMKQHILIFFTKLLSRSKHPLLSQINVHRPAHKLAKLCGEILASPFEKEEMHFVCVLCSKIKEDSNLVHCFIEFPQTCKHESSLIASVQSKVPNFDVKSVEFSLIKSIMSLMQSPDSWISIKACEGLLLLCTSLPDLKSAEILVLHTQLCKYLVSRLASLYRALPLDLLDPSDIDEVYVQWGISDNDDSKQFPGQRQLISYLSWLDYVDTLCNESHPRLQHVLATTFSSEFAAAILKPSIISEWDNNNQLAFLSLVTKSFRQTVSRSLIQEFSHFLLGDSINLYVDDHCAHPIRQRFMELANKQSSSEVNMMVLKLFEEMMLKFDEEILYNLILCTLVHRGYYDTSAADGQVIMCPTSCSADVICNTDCDDPFYTNEDFDLSPGSSPASKTLAPNNIRKIINCFLLLVPEEVKSCHTHEETGFDHYVRDAHNQYQSCVMRCIEFDWPREAISKDEMHGAGSSESTDDASSDSQPEADKQRNGFYEGAFLALLFDKLEDIINQPYEISLEVTSLISKLALLPHPYLHEYLLNPFIPLPTGARSLTSVLIKVVSELQVKVDNIDDFYKKLQMTRQALLGDFAEYDSFEHGNVLEAIIVIEEFCKELAAIAFVKYHASS